MIHANDVQRLMLGHYTVPEDIAKRVAPPLAGKQVVVTGFLIRHPEGPFVFDTGPGQGDDASTEHFTVVRRDVVEALRARGVDAASASSIRSSIRTMKKAVAPAGYEKVSATLEAPVLREIRERTTNVSGFLNDAAKRELYFERLREFSEKLDRQGVKMNERLYRNLLKLADTPPSSRYRRPRRSA